MTPRRKPDERRREIADAVLKIVAEDGVARLTAAAIAREVGVTDAALFHHFHGMEEIFLVAIDRLEELLFQPPPPNTAEPLERLGDFFVQRVSVVQRNPGAGRLLLSDLLTQIAPPSGTAKVRAFKRRSVEFIRSCLLSAHRRGLLARGLDVPTATVMVLGSLMALTQARDLVLPGGSAEALGGAVWLNLERLLRRRSRAAGVRRPPALRGAAFAARGAAKGRQERPTAVSQRSRR